LDPVEEFGGITVNAWWHRVVLLAFILPAAACSTADYSKPVNDFAAATDKAQTALSELNTQVTEAYRQVLEKRILSGEVFLTPDDGGCQVTSQRCRLIAVDKGNSREFYPPRPPLARMTQVMAEINLYAANLKAVVEADTASKVEANVNAALGSVQTLAQTVAEARAGAGAQPISIPQFATPAGEAINWIIGQYVASVKLKGLQNATGAAKQVVHDATELFMITSVFASDVPKADLAEEVSGAITAFREARNESNLNKLTQAADKYDALLVSAPPQLFKSLGAAHDALAENLQGEPVTLVTAIARIEAFANEASKVAKILEDLRSLKVDKKVK